jgi:AraC family transcriptional regulator, L-arginine-responsive activator
MRVGFLLIPRFSLLSLAGMIDVLAECNRVLDQRAFITSFLSVDGAPVASSGPVTIPVDHNVDASPELDAVFVLSDAPLPQRGHEDAVAWLQKFALIQASSPISANKTASKRLGGIGTGAYLLARAGLLRGYRATIHWPYASLFGEDFPDTVVSSNLFEIDRQRLTCAGGGASVDMMINWAGSLHGEDLVTELLDHFGLERLRTPADHQRVPLSARIGGGQPKLTEAVSLMEANYEEPLPTEEIARLVGVSRRQLERLFKQYLNSLPSRYYLELRLNRARHLLQQTSQSILQIGLSCGFSSGPHFSSAYRHHFGITPREQRSQRARGGLPENSGEVVT